MHSLKEYLKQTKEKTLFKNQEIKKKNKAVRKRKFTKQKSVTYDYSSV